MFDTRICMSVFADCAWKATAILLAAGGLSILLRRASASVRHLVWASVLAAVLVIPVISAVMPRWTVTLWRDPAPALESALIRADVVASHGTASVEAATRGLNEVHRSAGPGRTEPGSRTVPWTAIWMVGAACVLLQLALSRVALASLGRKTKPARESLVSLAREIRDEMGIRKEVRVLETAAATTPLTWGILRPVLLIPSVAADSGAERMRAILIHEMAHIARADYLWQTLGRLACAFYWFHPLVWLAQRETLWLREQAADDRVLNSGIPASDYAGCLVHLARSLAVPRMCGSLAIARRSHLERRVRAILDPSVRRRVRSRLVVLAGAVAAVVFTAAVASVRPVGAQAAQTGVNLAEMETGAAAAAGAYRFEEAADLLRRAAETRKAQFGANSVEYARSLAKLGALYGSLDRWNAMSECYSIAAPILEGSLGPSAPELFEPAYFSALRAQSVQDSAKAASLYQRAMEIQRANQIAGSKAALALTHLAILRLEASDFSQASQLIGEALAAVPQDSPERSVALAAQSRILNGLGRSAETLEAHRRAEEVQAAWIRRETSRAATQTHKMPALRVGEGVSRPIRIGQIEPEYSIEARINKFEGAVVLSIIIDKDGLPQDIQVTRPAGLGLDQKAVEAIRQWRFKPGEKDGQPVAVVATVEMNFRLL
jgi:TonB family protein